MAEALKRLAILGLCALCALLPVPPAFAGPTGEVVIEGQATFTRPDDHTTIIDTATQQTIVEYDSFDILQGELVEINQPTNDSKIINHVPFGDPTQISGQLHSNGYVYIVNPSGIFVGDQAVIDVGGLVAAAGRISYDEFLAGQDHFTELGGEVVVADGALVRADDTVALLGQRVANYGTIISEGGMIAFVAGSEAVLASLDGRMMVRVDGADGGASPLPDDSFAITQAGELDAGSGRVLLTAGDTYSLAMNHTGVTRAGEIELHAQGDGLVQVSGTLDAGGTGDGESGGSIAVTGDKIALLDATLDASGDAGGGEIRVGGDVQGAGSLRTASRTYVSPLSQLVADAITRGDGGSIVVWSDEKTGFYGSASARGGAQGGDGGFVEISGRQSLDARGHHVDLSAPFGRNGTLLYDPLRIEIVGGSADGSDLPDLAADQLASDGGTLGQILEGDAGDDSDPFLVYESELESTLANVILQAEEQIFVSGTFVDDDVVITPGNSLVIQTTGAAPDGEFGIDLGPSLTWRVSEGGVIDIRTMAGDANNPANTDRADIRIGNLEFGGRAFESVDGLSVPQLVTPDAELVPFGLSSNAVLDDLAVNVETSVGDIIVGTITANGEDSADGGRTFASAGGNVLVGSVSGNVLVDRIESVGGSAVAGAPSSGGAGGQVQIDTGNGAVVVVNGIDVSGGDGLAGIVTTAELPDGEPRSGVGGAGGSIDLFAGGSQDTPASVGVGGDLLADGGSGDGVASISTDAGSADLSGRGGRGGFILVESHGDVVIGDGSGSLVSASGGNGIAGGGVSGDEGIEAIRIFSGSGEQTGTFDVLLQNVDMHANGGDAGMVGGAGGAGGVLVAGPGGSGGQGGNLFIDAVSGSVLGADARIEANGGNAAAPSFPAGDVFAARGGSTRTLTIEGDQGVEIGDIVATGGNGIDGGGGEGARVSIRSTVGDEDAPGNVVVADIDVSGGDASPSADQAANGGDGGSISLDTRPPDVNGNPVLGGSVIVVGVLASLGGTGKEADGTTDRIAKGGNINIDSNQAIEMLAGGLLQGGNLDLVAPIIGSLSQPIDIAGTAAAADVATLTTFNLVEVDDPNDDDDVVDPPLIGTIHANLVAGHGLESLTVTHQDELASSNVTHATAGMLVVDGATLAGESATLALMQTSGVGPAPTLGFVLDTDPGNAGSTGDEPSLLVEVGAVDLGDAGGSIRNDDGAIVVESGAAGSASHVESTGNVVLEATDIGASGEALRVDGDTQASLALDASGDVFVDVVDVTGGGAFGAIDVTQRLATAETTLQGLDGAGSALAGHAILVSDQTVDGASPQVGLTGSWSSDLAYRHAAAAASGGAAPTLAVQDLVLGGSGVLEATHGDLRLDVDANSSSVELTSAGSDLLLTAGGDVVGEAGARHVQLFGSGLSDTADLVIQAQSGAVSDGSGGFLETANVDRLAARFGDELRLRNDGGVGGIEIAQIQVTDLADRSGDTFELTQTGVTGNGDFTLDNGSQRIVLGEIPAGSATAAPTHVSVAGDAIFQSAVELENAQFVGVLTGGTDDDGDPVVELVASNGARVEAGGDVEFRGSIDTSAGSIAVDDITDPMQGTPEPPVFVSATLVVDADGSASYSGDVGSTRALALFDTSDAVLTGATPGETREIHAGDVVFRGTLDGPASAVIREDETTLPPDDDTGTSVSFGGDVGGRAALEGLDVQADGIHFALAGGGSAERVNVGDGGIRLDTQQASNPSVATITDGSGNLRLQTSGDFAVGTFDKLSAVGDLQIAAGGSVTVGDLSASRISVTAPDIIVMTRAGGDVELPDGTLLPGGDGGVDWVANDIVASTPLTPLDPNLPIALYIGSGGISIPGGLGAYHVRYANPGQQSISAASLIGQDGVMLDLTGGGPTVFADATRAMPREVDPMLPEPLPIFGVDDPAAGAQVSARQVWAFLHCSGLGREAACGEGDLAALAGVDRFEESALATPRAHEITARYRELLFAPGAAERLREAFATAGRAYGQSVEWQDGTLDGAEFFRFLEAARGTTAEALASVRELAWLFAEIDLLGMADEDTRRLQQTLAQQFADAAGLQGFDAQQVSAAVDASPVGLP